MPRSEKVSAAAASHRECMPSRLLQRRDGTITPTGDAQLTDALEGETQLTARLSLRRGGLSLTRRARCAS
jgi:hypothetical protein